MSEQNDQTPTPGAESPVDRETIPGQGNDAGEPANGSPANKEARFRAERNQAREALAQAQALIEMLQTRELERIASKALSNPADLLTLSGQSLSDFIGEDGELDHELITETANEILGTRPGLRARNKFYDPTQGMGNDRPVKGKLSFDDLIR